MAASTEFFVNDLKNHEVLRKSFAHQLPKIFDDLHHLFSEMEKVVATLHCLNKRITLNDVAKNLNKINKIKFDERKLSVIIGIYPSAYKLRWEKRRQMPGKISGSIGYDLVMAPNLSNYEDLEPFLSEILSTRNLFSKVKAEPVDKAESTNVSVKAAVITEKPSVELTKKMDSDAVALSKYKLSVQQLSPVKGMTGGMELRRTPKTPYTPMRRLNFVDTPDSAEKPFQLPVGTKNFVSPVKLISPTKKRGVGMDYIRKSPMKLPAVPELRPAQVDPSPKMTPWRKEVRKKIFRHNLVTIVKGYHEILLQEKNVTISPNKFHPDFDPKTVVLPRGKLPEKKEGAEKQLRSAAQFFDNMKPKKKDAQPSLLKSPSPLKKIPPIVERNTPKTSLLERIKARKTADKMPSNPEEAMEKISLQVLNNSLIEIMCSIFKMQNKHSMDVSDLMPVVLTSYGQIDRETFLQHINALCRAAPRLCKIERLKKDIYLKISEVRVDKLKRLVENRLSAIG